MEFSIFFFFFLHVHTDDRQLDCFVFFSSSTKIVRVFTRLENEMPFFFAYRGGEESDNNTIIYNRRRRLLLRHETNRFCYCSRRNRARLFGYNRNRKYVYLRQKARGSNDVTARGKSTARRRAHAERRFTLVLEIFRINVRMEKKLRKQSTYTCYSKLVRVTRLNDVRLCHR